MAANFTVGTDNYLFSRDSLATGRLTAQHFLILRRSGWHLHPDIAVKVHGRKKLTIADVACGNGIWALDMARDYPQAHFTGIDISPQQFPPKFTWPRNVTMETYDIFQPMPDRYIGRFDIVHVRFIMGAVYSQNKNWVLQNILKLLKPGGFIQWTDATVPLLHVLSDPLQPLGQFRQPPAIEAPLASIFSPTEWLRRLADEFQQHGLINTRAIDLPPVPWLSKQETDNAIWALTDIHEGLKVRLGKEVAARFGAAVQETLEEIRHGRVYFATYYMAIGQKPG
ncbi:uncharacterized protein Z518_10461 [Rhinocladiella mackenziei CBS 650.93]|uniref:Methyltransferase type 12 domain-containing protein n=1 Tax=Rhinocladiella mackenziei CBS 650.93 TaxID=1442369 RepID=A0A0D2FE11_9EURO|nr:uncharacterized protein Z518_10461 [Rhinocladiella mackenziei CBS 650.93]KIX00322.1 hypothetical protein Z518_10461 [Rhinocladiella mackenziei CBS 650.93]